MFIISLKKSYKTLIYFLTNKPKNQCGYLQKEDIEVCVASMFVSNLVLNLIFRLQYVVMHPQFKYDKMPNRN